jgi:hypothetical protein
MALPMPREAPVTRATLPERGLGEDILDGNEGILKIGGKYEVVGDN